MKRLFTEKCSIIIIIYKLIFFMLTAMFYAHSNGGYCIKTIVSGDDNLADRFVDSKKHQPFVSMKIFTVVFERPKIIK